MCVYSKWAKDVLSRVYAEYIRDRVRELWRMSGLSLKSVKVTVPKLITVTIVSVCVGQIRQRRVPRSDKLERYSIYTYIVTIFSPMIDSAHVPSELRLDLLHDDLHKDVKVLGTA